MDTLITPVTWKPANRPVGMPKDMPSMIVSARKAASALGVSLEALHAATICDWRGLDRNTTNRTPKSYGADQVFDLMEKRKRPGRAALQSYLKARLQADLDAQRWVHRYPNSYICEDMLG